MRNSRRNSDLCLATKEWNKQVEKQPMEIYRDKWDDVLEDVNRQALLSLMTEVKELQSQVRHARSDVITIREYQEYTRKLSDLKWFMTLVFIGLINLFLNEKIIQEITELICNM